MPCLNSTAFSCARCKHSHSHNFYGRYVLVYIYAPLLCIFVFVTQITRWRDENLVTHRCTEYFSTIVLVYKHQKWKQSQRDNSSFPFIYDQKRDKQKRTARTKECRCGKVWVRKLKTKQIGKEHEIGKIKVERERRKKCTPKSNITRKITRNKKKKWNNTRMDQHIINNSSNSSKMKWFRAAQIIYSAWSNLSSSCHNSISKSMNSRRQVCVCEHSRFFFFFCLVMGRFKHIFHRIITCE